MPMFKRSMLVLLAILFLAGGYAFYSCESASDNETQLDSTLLPKENNTEAKEQEAGSGQEVAVLFQQCLLVQVPCSASPSTLQNMVLRCPLY